METPVTKKDMGFSTLEISTPSRARKLPPTSEPNDATNVASPKTVRTPTSTNGFGGSAASRISKAASPVGGNNSPLRYTSLSVKRAASGSVSSESTTEHGLGNGSFNKHVKKKHKYHDLRAKTREFIGTYKGEGHLPVYAKECQSGEVHIYVYKTSDLPLRLLKEYDLLAEATQDTGIDLNDVVLSRSLFPGYVAVDLNALAKDKRLQLVKNYLQSKKAVHSRSNSSISTELENLPFVEQEVRVVSPAASVTNTTDMGTDDAVEKHSAGHAAIEAASAPVKPADHSADLHIGHHKKDRNIPVFAYLRREPNPEVKTVLFRVSLDQAKKSKFSFPCLAIKDENLLRDVILSPAFALESIQEIKSAIICHLNVSARLDCRLNILTSLEVAS